jgi:hypothetical protein
MEGINSKERGILIIKTDKRDILAEKNNELSLVADFKSERKTGLEPATYSLGSCRSTR